MSDHSSSVAPWEDFTLRLIAVYKLSKTAVFIALGIGLLQLLHHNVQDVLRDYVIEPMHFDPENRLLKWALDSASQLTDHRIRFISYFAFFAAIFFAVEGIGLYLRKHWAEYLVLISTGSLLPIEVWEVCHHVEWWKAGVLLGNLAILLYLAHRLVLDSQNAGRRRQEEADEKARADRGESHPGSPAKVLADPQ